MRVQKQGRANGPRTVLGLARGAQRTEVARGGARCELAPLQVTDAPPRQKATRSGDSKMQLADGLRVRARVLRSLVICFRTSPIRNDRGQYAPAQVVPVPKKPALHLQMLPVVH